MSTVAPPAHPPFAVTGDRLLAGERSVAFAHFFAPHLLALLIDRGRRGVSLSRDDVVQAWHRLRPGLPPPDRTAVRRAVQAARAAVAAVTGDDGIDRLQCAPRCLTVGPWRWEAPVGEVWDVSHLLRPQAEPADAEPTLGQGGALVWCDLASTLVVADDMARVGSYVDAAQVLRGLMADARLSAPGRCVVGLRLLRMDRRTGALPADHAAQWGRVLAQAEALPGPLGAHTRAALALLDARRRFDAAPHDSARSLDMVRLRRAAAEGASPHLQMEVANLRALGPRRRIGALLAQRRHTPAGLAPLVQDALDASCAAYLWALVAHDAYYQQAMASNMAYLLHWLHRHDLHDGLRASIAWFRLAHTLVERFDLPQDSAWDFIMLAEVYFSSPEARALVEADALTWPAQQSPATENFYIESIRIAVQHGEPRQRLYALNQHVQWLRLKRPSLSALRNALQARDQALAQHPALVADMMNDGFVVA